MLSTRRRPRPRSLAALTLVAATIVAACGGDNGSVAIPTTTDAPATTAAPAADEGPGDDGDDGDDGDAGGGGTDGGGPATSGIASYREVQPAVVQIVASGTRREPEGYNWAGGFGSGFVISPDGVVVTNHHVVTGAATLEVFIGGDQSRSYNARILGVSECNDLAVIQINNVSDLPVLEWYDDELEVGLPVYAAGFPLGNPEYTLTQGIISKAQGNPDLTGGSSIDRTIEHDANLQGGNSGGPLVGEDGRVVGVNYAFDSAALQGSRTNTAQFFAIAADLARPLVEQLRDGDVESIGINGWAIVDPDLGLTGIWVAGVEAGTPAAQVGLLPGDIITTLNGLPMAMDGTFKDYCDVLRTAGDRPIAIEVLRFDTGEILRGELRSGERLEVARTFGAIVDEEVDIEATGTAYNDFVTVVDDTGQLAIDVPVQWADVSTEPQILDGLELPFIVASPDIELLLGTYRAPGLILTLIRGTNDIEAALSEFAPPPGECTDAGADLYEDAKFTGIYRVFVDCGGTGAALVVLAATGPAQDAVVLFAAQLITQADIDVLDRLFASFDAAA